MSVTQKFETRDDSAAKPRTCVAHALRLLTRRLLSAHDLADALLEAGYEAEEVEATMAQVRAWGYINDERLADAAMAQAVRRKKGPAWLTQELSRRHLPQGAAREAVTALRQQAPSLAQEILASRFKGLDLADSRTALRAMRLLQRRGFDGATIRAALQAARKGQDPGDDFA